RRARGRRSGGGRYNGGQYPPLLPPPDPPAARPGPDRRAPLVRPRWPARATAGRVPGARLLRLHARPPARHPAHHIPAGAAPGLPRADAVGDRDGAAGGERGADGRPGGAHRALVPRARPARRAAGTALTRIARLAARTRKP